MRYSANLNIMIKAVEEARIRTARDFSELEVLQTNKPTAKKYANSCYQRVKKFLIDDLTKMRPEYNIFSSDGDSVINQEDAEYSFFIHPIDGLVNLSRAIDQFAIAISLNYHQEGQKESIACVIHKPIGGDLYYTEKGFNPFMNSRKIRVANCEKESKLIGCSIDNSQKFNDKEIINRNFGCKTLEIAYLASGKIDYLEIDNNKIDNFQSFLLLAIQSGAKIEKTTDKTIIYS